jgi:hypothetical protein
MKSVTKLSFLAAALAALGTSAALADDPQLQSRLNMQRAQVEPVQRTTTIAFYSGHRAVGQREVSRNEASEQTRFEWRQNAKTGYGVYVQGQ